MNHSFRKLEATPSCKRIRRRFDSIAVGDSSSDVGHLVLAVLLEESLGGRCLQNLGITLTRIADGCFGDVVANTNRALQRSDADSGPEEIQLAASEDGFLPKPEDELWLTGLFDRARMIARRVDHTATLGSEHLVQAMVELQGPAQTQLAELGITVAEVEAELSLGHDESNKVLTVEWEFAPEVLVDDDDLIQTDEATPYPNIQQRVLAVLDANLNRTREGLRVLEDFARFVARDAAATGELKRMRHQLVAAERLIQSFGATLLQQRAVEHDVGTGITTEQEQRRESVADVVVANARRVQEALRSLEEFGKMVSSEFAAVIKQLRYQSYSLEQKLRGFVDVEMVPHGALTSLRVHRLDRLQHAVVYVLLTDELCRQSWQGTAEAALAGGADVIQLREKNLSDDVLISRGRWLAAACESAGAIFILSDRSDLADAAGAHGVHVGQDDDSVAAARTMLNPDQLLGVSTHDVAQVQAACNDGADYLGVGPVFQSATKQFDGFPGIEFVKAAAEFASVPWFAIGGINIDTVSLVLLSGAGRIAVSNAVIGSEDPEAAVRDLREAITAENEDPPASVKFSRG